MIQYSSEIDIINYIIISHVLFTSHTHIVKRSGICNPNTPNPDCHKTTQIINPEKKSRVLLTFAKPHRQAYSDTLLLRTRSLNLLSRRRSHFYPSSNQRKLRASEPLSHWSTGSFSLAAREAESCV